MGGGLMQLVAYGAQDIYLTGNPQITFFKVVYRRHTNFSMETIQQTINGTSGVINNSVGTVTISRNGDLVSKVYVTTTAATTDGSNIISKVECEIGGQLIDRQYQEWNDIWNELSIPESKALGFKSMQLADGGTIDTTGVGLVQVPLNFWFCRNPGLALPLIALQYHEVKLKFTWGSGGGTTAKVWCDYIYLDTDERRRFAQVSHEYLIEQIQKQSATATTSTKLNFNHPVKEIIWTSARTNAYTTARLVLNGHDRFADQEPEYFQLRGPFDYHTSIPRQNLPTVSKIGLNTGLENGFTLDAYLGTVLDVHTTASGGASRVHYASNVLTIRGDTGETGTLDNFQKGMKIAITVHTLGNADVYTGVTLPVVGDTFIGTISGTATLSATTANNVLTIPTTNFEYPIAPAVGGETLTALVTGSGGGKVIVTCFNPLVAGTSKMTKKINVYSFALKPEEHQPSGTCNFSRIDNAQLRTGAELTAADNIYAVNYNVLRIMSGMGGLAYSN